jgi:hypothetical protein
MGSIMGSRRSGGNLSVERHGDCLVVRSAYTGRIFCAVWTVCLACVVAANVRGSIDVSSPFDVAVTALLFGVGLFGMSSRKTIPSFDTTNSIVSQDQIIANIWRWRKRRYFFDEISGIGVNTYRDGDGDELNQPIITLENGKNFHLLYSSESYSAAAQLCEDIRTATTLPRIDKHWRDARDSIESNGGWNWQKSNKPES